MMCKVIGPDGRVKMQTASASCIPPADVQKAMRAAGYKITIKGTKQEQEETKCKK